MNKREKELKQSVVKATESIRNKFKELFNEKSANKYILEEQYKPITTKLSSLIDVNRTLGGVKSDTISSKPNSSKNSSSDNDDDDVMEVEDITSDQSSETKTMNRNRRIFNQRVLRKSKNTRNGRRKGDSAKIANQLKMKNRARKIDPGFGVRRSFYHLMKPTDTIDLSEDVDQSADENNQKDERIHLKEQWSPYSTKRSRGIQGDEISPHETQIEEELTKATLPPVDSDNNNNNQSSLEWDDEFKEERRNSKKSKTRINSSRLNTARAMKKNAESTKAEQTENARKVLDEVYQKQYEKNYSHARRDASFDALSRLSKHKLVEEGIDDIEDLGEPSNKLKTGSKRPGIGKKGGKGLADMNIMQLGTGRSCPNMYKYWNNVNELVARLRLLVSSKSSGHTGHDNEILSIIEELREADIIV